MQTISTIRRLFSNISRGRSINLLLPLMFLTVSGSLLAQDYALNFNGSGQYVDCGAGDLAITGAAHRTVEAWVYTRSFNDAGVFQMGVPGNILGEFTLRTTTADNQWVVQIWTQDFNIVVPNSKNNWVHFALTYDGSNMKLYANGNLVADHARDLNTISANFHIGHWAGAYFDGMIDEVLVYNYARSASQIEKDFLGHSTNDGDLNRLAYYKMTNGSGTSLSNNAWYHSYNNTATIVGATWVTGVFESYPVGAGTNANPYQIGSMRDLHWLSQTTAEWDKEFRQVANIDGRLATQLQTGYAYGFSSIGSNASPFTGVYDGNGFAIDNIYMKRTHAPDSDTYFVGLFARTSGATISNLGVTDVHSEGYQYVGGLIGEANNSTVDNCYVSGAVLNGSTSSTDIGGLIGKAVNSDVDDCYSSAAVSGRYHNVGGLIGLNSSSTLDDCYATGNVSASSYPVRTGGLVGENSGTSIITNCYASSAVTSGGYEIGGLVGKNAASVVSSYTLGSVAGGAQVGGLIGYNYSGGTIDNCYSKATVTGSQFLGGLIGQNAGSVNHTYASGPVSGGYQLMGGLIGSNNSTVSHSFWDTQTTGQSTSAGGTARTTAEMNRIATFSNAEWAFPTTWHIDESLSSPDNAGYPSITGQGLDHILRPEVTTQAVTSISTTSATANGSITDLGAPIPTQYGFCWNTSTNPTTSHNKTEKGAASAAGAYSSAVAGLTPGTTYFIRAYATNTAGTFYGNEVSFTSYVPPEITTQAISEIGTTTATGHGTVTNTGIPDPTQHGVCWSTDHNPTLTNSHTTDGELAPVSGSASATYSAGHIPTDKNFTNISGSSSCPGTLTVTIPLNATITSVDVAYSMTTASDGYMSEQRTQLRCVSASGTSESQLYSGAGTYGTHNYNRTGLTIANGVGGGDIDFELHAGRTYGGSGCNTSYNMVNDGTWIVTIHYTIPGNIFESSITGLTPFTSYYVKAYATNAVGTVYGNEVSFISYQLPTVTTQAISDIFTTTATGNGNLSDLGNPNPIQYGHCWSTSETPTIADAKTEKGAISTTGAYSSSITGLSTSTIYYIRAYATNLAGTVYGSQESFTTWDALPEFSAMPSSHAFGSLLVGEIAQQTITVTNTGGGSLNISAVSPPNAAFSVSPITASIAGSSTQQFAVTFAPTAAGALSGNLAFTDNVGNHAVAISGTGLFQAQTNASSAISFDGVDDYVQTDLDAQPSALTTTTFETWFKPTRLNHSSFQGILSTDDGGWDRGIWVSPNTSRVIVGYGTDGWLVPHDLTVNTWYHLAVVYKSDNVLCYLNGIEYSLGAAPTGQVTTQKLRIGGDVSNIQMFQGEIDEVRIWNDVRTPQEIQGNYGSLEGNEAGLKGYWRLDEGSGTTTGDGSGNSHTGNLANGPTWVTTSGASVAEPVYSISPSSHDFGSLLIGENDSQNFTVSNTGGGFLNISAATAPSSQYSASPTTAVISASGSQVITLNFEPTSSGADNGNLTITDNLGTHNTVISGTGAFQSQDDAGNTLTLNGSSQYLEGDLVSTATDNISMEAWVNWDGQTGSTGILYNGNSGGNGYGLMLFSDVSQNITILCGGVGFLTSATALPTGGWHHIAAVREAGTWKLYLDGAQKALSASATAPNTPTGSFNIGSTSAGGQIFKGKIDEVRFWEIARSQTQIQASYASLAGNETGLVGYWRLDEGSGTTTGDGSGYGKSLNLMNSPIWGSSSAPVDAPVFSASPSSHAFVDILVGESAQQNITISNTGAGVLHLNSISTPGADFNITPVFADIVSGGNQVFTLTFTPSSSTAQSGNLAFTTNLGNCNFVLSGTGEFIGQDDGENAVNFDGVDDYVEMSGVTTTTNFTVELWVNPDNYPSSGTSNHFLAKGNMTSTKSYFVEQYPERFCVRVNPSATAVNFGSIPVDSWTHLAFSYDGTTLTTYTNGNVSNSTVLGVTPTSSEDILVIGDKWSGGTGFGSAFYDGQVDEARLWNTVRTTTQIQSSYASLAGNETGLVGYWRFDEGNGTSSGDATGNGNSAILNNGVSWPSSTAPITAPVFSVSPGSLDFGTLLIGEQSSRSITVSNAGGSVLHLTSISTPGSDFVISPASAAILAGGNQVFAVTFEPTSGSAQSGNLSFTNNTGTHTVALTGAGQFQAQSGAENMISLDGVDDYLSVGNTSILRPTQAVSVEAWVRPTAFVQFAAIVDNMNWTGTNIDGYELYTTSDGHFGCKIGSASSASDDCISSSSYTVNQWYHVAFTYDKTSVKLYVNGILEGEKSFSQDIDYTDVIGDYGLNIGRFRDENEQIHFNGKIDEVRLWNDARTHSELQASYASLAGNDDNLVGYWRLDEASGTLSGDATGNGNTATLANGTAWLSSTAPISAPVYSSSDASLNFGNVSVSGSSDETFTITNTAGGFLDLSSLSSDNDKFTVTPSSVSLSAGASQEFTATFAPTTHGSQSGTLTLTHNPNGATSSISLGGLGQQALLSANPTSMDFGNVQVNVASSETLTIANDGNIALNISGIGCSPSVYSISPTSATISAGGTQEFTVSLTANTVGTVSGTLTFTDNALNTPQEISVTADAVDLFGAGTQLDPFQIATLQDLQVLSENSSFWDRYLVQTADIDASATSTWNSSAGYSPIGVPGTGYFQGTYDGGHHTIDGLVVNRSGSDYQGLFGVVSGGSIMNLSLTNVNITGKGFVGGLVGQTGYNNVVSAIENCSSSGSVTGNYESVGGLVGRNNNSSITKSFSNCSVVLNGNYYSVGGLVGHNPNSSVTNCYASASVNGWRGVGGLIGNNDSGTVNDCYSTGTVIGTGSYDIGGLIGCCGPASNSFWDTQTSGQVSSYAGTGKTTAELQIKSTFTASGWDFEGESTNGTDNIWNMGNGRNSGYPYLDWQHPDDPIIQPASLTTSVASSVTTSSANTGGEVADNPSGQAVTSRGVCWSTTSNPTTLNDTTINGLGIGAFSAELTSLTTNTTYHVRSYATNLAGTSYGLDVSFTALGLGTVTTQAISEIGVTTAKGNGNITYKGNPDPTHHGICWGLSEDPALDDFLTDEGSVSEVGAFTTLMTGLTPNTLYHVRAYSTNTVGTVYGADVSFTSLLLPTVTTQAVADIDTTTATGNGTITVLGSPAATQHGVCWGTALNPTLSDSKTQEGTPTSTGAFTSSITGLNTNTNYHLRAYATSTEGTVYGEDVSFNTLDLPTVTSQAITDIDASTATGNGNISDLGNPAPNQYGVCWSTLETPTVADSRTEEGAASTTGAFTSAMTGLTSSTPYYVRAYVTNTVGTRYGSQVSFNTAGIEPTEQATEIVFSDLDRGSMTLSWSNGNGAQRMVFLKEATSGEAPPIDHTSYSASSVFGSGSQIGTSGWYCVYNGTGSAVAVTNLTQQSTYRAMVCEFNGLAGGENYLTSPATNNPTHTQLSYFVDLAPTGLPLLREGNAEWGDYDNDGDLDLVVTGSAPNYALHADIYQNNGDNTFSFDVNMVLPGIYRGSADWGDYDNDGYLDMLLTGDPSAGGAISKVFRNVNGTSFSEVTSIVLDPMTNGDAAWGDYDNDGDLDILLAGGYASSATTRIYRNNGDNTFTTMYGISLAGLEWGNVTWIDFNGDGLLDIFNSGQDDSYATHSKLYRNNGNDSFTEMTETQLNISGRFCSAWGDYNSDGYPDVALADWGSSKLFKNNGDGSFSEETGISLPGLKYGSMEWGDYDSDGDLDLLSSGTYGTGARTIIFRNNGNSTFTEESGIVLAGSANGATLWADFDHDDDLDILLQSDYYYSGYHYTSTLYENIGSASNSAPSLVSNLAASVGENVQLSWDKATDAQTAQNSLSYNLYVGSSSETVDGLSPMANIDDGVRRVVHLGNSGLTNSHALNNLPGGTYSWGVQVLDNSFAGSGFVTGPTFYVVSQSEELVFSNIAETSMDIQWTSGELDNRVVFMKQTDTGTPVPANGSTYSASPIFGSGSQIGTSGWYCIYNGSGSSVSVSGLVASADYRLMVCEYSGSAGSESYLLTTTNRNPETQVMPHFIEQVSISLSGVSNGSLDWGDYDNDGWQDIVICGEVSYPNNITKIYKNNGGNSFIEQSSISLPGVKEGSVEWGDYDNDGDLDLLLTGQVSYNNYISKVYRNNGDNSFSEQTSIELASVAYGTGTWGDFNNDGYLDILITGALVGGNRITRIYANQGDATFALQDGLSLTDFSSSDASWGDYDNDGDLDVAIMGYGHNGSYLRAHVRLYQNTGDNTFTDQTSSLNTTDYFSSGEINWGDYDSDGDLDLIVSGGTTALFRNNGNGTFTDQSDSGLMQQTEASASWGDYDNDGDLDLVQTGSSSGSNLASILANVGNNQFVEQTSIALEGVDKSSAAWGDYDNDGDLDLLLSGYNGSVNITKLYKNVSPIINAGPTAPSNLQVNASNSVSFTWDAGSDTETAQAGLTYNLYIGSTQSNCAGTPPHADQSNGRRRLTRLGNAQLNTSTQLSGLATGTYYWGVQTIDNSFVGSTFSSGPSFFYFAPPTTATSDLTFSNIHQNDLTLSWTNGTGSRRAVFVTLGPGGSPAPVSDIVYGASSDFGSGTQIGSSGWYCVYNGTGTSGVINNLDQGQAYRFAVIEYNQDGENIRYLDAGNDSNPITYFPLRAGSGLALNFDGTNDYVELPNTLTSSISGGSAITIEYWFKGSQLQSPVRLQDGNGYIVTGWQASNPIHIISTDGGTTNGLSVGSESIVEDGTWHHLALTWQSNTENGFCSYLDGILVASRTSANVLLPVYTDANLIVGSYIGQSEFMNGSMDELRIWNTARSHSEILANMCSKIDPESATGLLAYYNFDGAVGAQNLPDLKNNHTGTLVNFDVNVSWVQSGVPLGSNGMHLASMSQTPFGYVGQQCLVTITSEPNASNFLNLYTSIMGNGPTLVPQVGSWPGDVVMRADVIWGVHAIGSVTANLVFDYSQVGGVSSPELIRLIKRADGCAEWVDVTTDFIHNTAARTFTVVGNNSFSEYSVGSEAGDNSLPVELSLFTARQVLRSIELSWKTDSEIENLGFILERKSGDDLIEIASYRTHEGLGGQGSVNDATEYEFIDSDINRDESYTYFLYDVDYQGQLTFLDSVQVVIDDEEWLRIPDDFSFGNIYPNPFNPQISLPFALPVPMNISVRIYDVRGREVITLVDGNYSAGRHTLVWNGTNAAGRKAATGVYILSCSVRSVESGESFHFNRKVLKLE